MNLRMKILGQNHLNPFLNYTMNITLRTMSLLGLIGSTYKVFYSKIMMVREFIHQILHDKGIMSLIDEFFFEHHVHLSPMIHHGWASTRDEANTCSYASSTSQTDQIPCTKSHQWQYRRSANL